MGEISTFSIRDSHAVFWFSFLTSCTFMNLLFRIILFLIVPEVRTELVTSFNKCEGLPGMHFVLCPYY